MHKTNGFLILLALVAVILLGYIAGKVAEPPQAAPTYTPWPTYTRFPTIDSTSTTTPTPWYTPTPETLYGYPTPEIVVWPTCVPHTDCLPVTPIAQRQDFTFHELYVGKYVLRKWCNIDLQFDIMSPCSVTISSNGNKQIEILGYPAYLGNGTGADLTGRGKPDIVIIDWGGGNCCVSTLVYEAGDELIKIMDIGSHWVGNFTDLNGDGTYEYIAVNRRWSGFCKYCEVWPSIVYQYQPELGYIPATYKFKDVLSADINEGLDFLDQFTEHNPSIPLYFATDTDSENKYWQSATNNWDYRMAVNAVYKLAAYYLLTGQQAEAQNILNKYFPSDKAAEYLLGIKQDLQGLLAP